MHTSFHKLLSAFSLGAVLVVPASLAKADESSTALKIAPAVATVSRDSKVPVQEVRRWRYASPYRDGGYYAPRYYTPYRANVGPGYGYYGRPYGYDNYPYRYYRTRVGPMRFYWR